MRILVALTLALVLAGVSGAAATTVLPRPGFPAPATGAGQGAVRFTILSSVAVDPAREVAYPRPHGRRRGHGRLMLQVGDRIPDATVWVGPREQHTIAEIVEDGPVLLLFYLFDWTGT